MNKDFTVYSQSGRKGTFTIEKAYDNKGYAIDGHLNINNVIDRKGTFLIAFYKNKVHLQIDGKLLNIDYNQRLIDFIWKESGMDMYTELYGHTTHHKNNWTD